jgi:hypothetical protein
MIQKQVMNICDKFFSEPKPFEQIGKLAIIKKDNELHFHHYHMLVMVWNIKNGSVVLTGMECPTDARIQRNYFEYMKTVYTGMP